MESPYKKAADSPSRQLLWELDRLQIKDKEQLYEQLDQENEDREWLHREALRRAAAGHEQVRKDAELFQQRLEADEELQREKQRQEELKAIQRLKQAKIDEEAAFRQEAAEAQEAARRAEEQRKAAAAAAEERERAEREREAAEVAQRKADEEARQRRDAEAKAKAAALASQQKAQSVATKQEPSPSIPNKPTARETIQQNSVSLTTSSQPQGGSNADVEHEHYVNIWQNLKDLRASLKEQSKSNPTLKKIMGDARRTIRKCVGQLSTGSDPAANRAPNVQLRNVIRDGLNVTEPQVTISDYLFDPPPSASGAKGPALLIYLLNIFSKCLIAQFVGEVAVAPKTASAIGITGATIFSQEDFRWNGIPLTDILIAKLHRVCPVLFGINGNDRTEAGKKRLGWWWADDGKMMLCTEQLHYERMTGLGAGFAAMTLRSFKRTTSPYPSWHFWRAMARILNTPKDQVTNTHLVVLKSMIEGNEARILEFFGEAGLLALRMALMEFPRQVKVKDGVAAQALLLIPDVLKKEKKLFL